MIEKIAFEVRPKNVKNCNKKMLLKKAFFDHWAPCEYRTMKTDRQAPLFALGYQ